MKNFLFVALLFSCTSLLNAQSADDEQALRQMIQTMQEGWNAADGKQFASVFAGQHDFVVWNGYYFPGISPEMNARSHQSIFDTMYRGTQLYYTIDKLRFVRPDVALLHVYGAVVKAGAPRPADPQVLYSVVAEKTDAGWQFISFHNLDLEMFDNEQIRQYAPMPPQRMYAGWYEDAGK